MERRAASASPWRGRAPYNVSFVAGRTVPPAGAVYAATKHAVRTLSEGLRQEVKPWNIRTTMSSPGVVVTELPASIGHSTEHSSKGV